MASFKEVLSKDIDTFLNLREFSELHNINGVFLNCLIDDDVLRENKAGSKEDAFSSRYRDGTYYGYETLYVKISDFGKAPTPGALLKIDGDDYAVRKVKEQMGIYEIEIMRNTYQGDF